MISRFSSGARKGLPVFNSITKASRAASGSPFNWKDPFLMDDQLTEDERAIRDSAQSYCEENLLTRITEANRNETFDKKIMEEMGSMGFLGPTITGLIFFHFSAYLLLYVLW